MFAAFDIADGTVISALHRRHRAVEFKKFLVAIDKTVLTELDVHIVCAIPPLTKPSPSETGWRNIHGSISNFTPTGSSWINQVERWFGYLADQLLRRGVHTSVAALEKDVRDWIADWNENPKPFAWPETADESLNSLAKYIERISGAGH